MITYEHGNSKCTGSALEVDASPATAELNGCFIFTMRPQTATAVENETGVRHPEFSDNENEIITAYLSVKHIAHLLCVLDGKASNVLDGKGLRLKKPDGNIVVVHLDSTTKPFKGFEMHMKRVGADGSCNDIRIMLSIAEGHALKDAVRSVMGQVAFALR